MKISHRMWGLGIAAAVAIGGAYVGGGEALRTVHTKADAVAKIMQDSARERAIISIMWNRLKQSNVRSFQVNAQRTQDMKGL